MVTRTHILYAWLELYLAPVLERSVYSTTKQITEMNAHRFENIIH